MGINSYYQNISTYKSEDLVTFFNHHITEENVDHIGTIFDTTSQLNCITMFVMAIMSYV